MLTFKSDVFATQIKLNKSLTEFTWSSERKYE